MDVVGVEVVSMVSTNGAELRGAKMSSVISRDSEPPSSEPLRSEPLAPEPPSPEPPSPEPLSPELALVDPELRTRALSAEIEERSVPPPRPETKSGPDPEPARAPAIERDPEIEHETAASALIAAPGAVEQSAPRRSRATFVLGAACGLVVAGAAVGALAILSIGPFGNDNGRRTGVTAPGTTASRIGTPAQSVPVTTVAAAPPVRTTPRHTAPGRTTHSATGPGATTPAKTPPAHTAPPKDVPHSLKFAWAPVAGASSYVFAVYVQSRRVLVARVKNAAIQIRVGSHSGPRTLAPGTYHWYVWPVRHGRQDSVAVVRARLVVPAAAAGKAAQAAAWAPPRPVGASSFAQPV